MDVDATFEASYERLIGSGIGITEQGQRFFKRFYENFLGSSEAIQKKFERTDMDRQQMMLQKGLYHLISFYLLKQDNEFIRNIASAHSRRQYDVSDAYYDLWLAALLKTVEELDPEFDEKLRLAWEIVMTPGILYMKHHYD